MLNYYKDKVVCITGAGSGIGASIARLLTKCEAKLILMDKNEKGLNDVKRVCSSDAHILLFDLLHYENMSNVCHDAINIYGHVDMLIHCAGQGCRSSVIETDIEVYEKICKINYLGNIALSKYMLPYFIKEKKGHFIVLSSITSKFGIKKRSAYAASKHALHGFYDSLRAEISDLGIYVTLICPCFVETKMLDNTWNGNGEIANKIRYNIKSLTAEECASKILKATIQKKEEVILGATFFQRKVDVVRRYFPTFFSKMMKKIKTD